ncbi:class I SAM-dependent methyltransferase [Streptomyces sp. N2-109]|uniref:Class I SAM-dependent methyltransferase n=2 Tax=Streptomyces gossypii TaxID=2883101 RepID=A0ABT2JSA1_9ACTN|nr:class I SAM-dependent methyltransferase [Streptomyces gossypii]
MAEVLDLDAEVLHTYQADVTAWLADLSDGSPPRRILDLGSGTGTGTFALLERFPEAHATALDVSPQMLHRLRDGACARGLDERVHTVLADLDAPWPSLDPADLAWAASSLHHMADPDHILTEAFRTLRPGGLLAIAEMDFFPRFLSDHLGLGRPGLEARVHAALNEDHGGDLNPALLDAGFTLETKRPFVIDLQHPLPAATGRYAQACLRRLRAHLDGLMDGEDLATLDTLIDSDGPDGVLRRQDLTVRTTRTVWVAKRPQQRPSQ